MPPVAILKESLHDVILGGRGLSRVIKAILCGLDASHVWSAQSEAGQVHSEILDAFACCPGRCHRMQAARNVSKSAISFTFLPCVRQKVI